MLFEKLFYLYVIHKSISRKDKTDSKKEQSSHYSDSDSSREKGDNDNHTSSERKSYVKNFDDD